MIPDSNPFTECARLALARHIRVFDDCTNFLILYLSPKHKALAISKNIRLRTLKEGCLKLRESGNGKEMKL